MTNTCDCLNQLIKLQHINCKINIFNIAISAFKYMFNAKNIYH